MALLAIYSSPATPGNAAWSEDVTGAIRLGSITGLGGEARLGATGNGNIVLDDPTSSIGHSGDGILGLKQFSVRELSCPIGNQRLWTGYVGDRTYRRGEGTDSSLRTGTARKIDVTLVDLNDFLSFRVFAPIDVDPTSSFVRGAETDLERVQGLLADVDFISDTLFDVGYIPSAGGVNMEANDYTGQRPFDVLNDCAQVSGRNFWVKYHEATNQYVLWYDNWKTDGSATLTYDSALRLTNVLSEKDDSTTFAGIDAQETLDPSRLVSGVYLPYDGGTAYGTEVTTSYIYAWRDSVMPSNSFIKSSTTADALITRYLTENSTEDPTIRVSVQLPNAKVTGIHEGMRLQVHFTHLPVVNAGFTWTRVLSRTIRVDVETQLYYWLDLELSPIPEIACAEDSIDAYYEDTRTPVMAASESFAIPAAPSGLPYAIVALGNVESQASLSVGPSVTLDTSGDWVDIGNFSVALGDYWHEVIRTGYLAQPAGTPETFDLTLTFVQATADYTDWAVAAVGVATADTAPVQYASSSGPNADSVTLPGSPTEGNILVLFITVREHADFTIPTGWTLLRTVNHHNSIGSNSWIYVCGSCVPASLNARIDLPTISLSIERHAFVSEWTPA